MPESSWGDGERDIYCPFLGDSKPGSDSFRGSIPFFCGKPGSGLCTIFPGLLCGWKGARGLLGAAPRLRGDGERRARVPLWVAGWGIK